MNEYSFISLHAAFSPVKGKIDFLIYLCPVRCTAFSGGAPHPEAEVRIPPENMVNRSAVSAVNSVFCFLPHRWTQGFVCGKNIFRNPKKKIDNYI